MQGYMNTAWLEAPGCGGSPWIDGETRFNVQVSPQVQPNARVWGCEGPHPSEGARVPDERLTRALLAQGLLLFVLERSVNH